MGLRSEQFNLRNLLQYFVSRNEYNKKDIVKLIGHLTMDEIDELNHLSYKEVYNLLFNFYKKIRLDFNKDEYIKINQPDELDVTYYTDAYLRTYPLKHILDVRHISYKDYEPEFMLKDKVLQSNAVYSGDSSDPETIIIGTDSHHFIKSIDVFEPDWIYSDFEVIRKIFLIQILEKRGIKYDINAPLEDLIYQVKYTNPIGTHYVLFNSDYLESNSYYEEEYLKKYGFKVLLTIKGINFNEKLSLSRLKELVNENNPTDENTRDLNTYPLDPIYGYYEEEWLEKYGIINALLNRNIDCNFDMTWEELWELLINSNPNEGDFELNTTFKRIINEISIFYGYMNSKIGDISTVSSNSLYMKSGITKFNSLNLNYYQPINHNTRLTPIIFIGNISSTDEYKVGEWYLEGINDLETFKIHSTGMGTENLTWYALFDNDDSYINLPKTRKMSDYTLNTDTNKTYYELEKEYFCFDSKIGNLEEILTENNANYYLDLSDYPDLGDLSITKIYINGVGYSLDIFDYNSYYTNNKVLTIPKSSGITLDANDEVSFSNYKSTTNFNEYIMINNNSSYGEANFKGDSETVTIEHKLKVEPSFVYVLPIERTEFDNIGNIYYGYDNENLYIYNTGSSTTKFRWFAYYDNSNNCKSYRVKLNGKLGVTVNLEDNLLLYKTRLITQTEEDKHIYSEFSYVDNSITFYADRGCKDEIYLDVIYNDIKYTNSSYLEYSTEFDKGADGYFTRNPDYIPSGNSTISYGGNIKATKFNSYQGRNISIKVPTNDNTIESGDVIAFNPNTNYYEKFNSSIHNPNLVIGIANNDYAIAIDHPFNDNMIYVAISGLVEVKINGTVNSGDLITPYNDGQAIKSTNDTDCIIGKVLTQVNNNIYLILKV